MKNFQSIYKFLITLDTKIWVAGATILSFAFGVYEIGTRNLWLDEAYSVYIVQRDWHAFWTIILNFEANQVLYYIILKFWILLGDDEATLRFLSAVFSTASVPVIYLIGKELFDKKTGAGSLTAGNSTPLTDGAAAVLLALRTPATKLGLG